MTRPLSLKPAKTRGNPRKPAKIRGNLCVCAQSNPNMLEKLAGMQMVLTVEEGGLPAWILGDAVRLQQIITNVVTNAIKFVDPGACSSNQPLLIIAPCMHRARACLGLAQAGLA